MDINRYATLGKLAGKHFISLKTYTEEEIYEILIRARDISTRLSAGEKLTYLKGKYISLMTERDFVSERIAFETAVSKLGGTAVVSAMSHEGLKNTIANPFTIKTIAGYGINAIVVQTSAMNDANLIHKSIELPIINATARTGPCTALAFLLTIWRKKGKLSGLKVAFVGNPEVFSDSAIYAFTNCGFDISFVCKEENQPSEDILNYCRQYCDPIVTDDIMDGLKGVDVALISADGFNDIFSEEHLSLMSANPIVFPSILSTNTSMVSDEVIASDAFSSLDSALCLPEIEMAIMSLLI